MGYLIVISCNKILPLVYDIYKTKEELKNFIIESKIIMDKNFKNNNWNLDINKNQCNNGKIDKDEK